jgi:hypothetical protein
MTRLFTTNPHNYVFYALNIALNAIRQNAYNVLRILLFQRQRIHVCAIIRLLLEIVRISIQRLSKVVTRQSLIPIKLTVNFVRLLKN